MPKPATLTALVEVIRASRLVPDDQLTAVLDKLRGEPFDDVPGPVLNQLILEGKLTSFQATQLAAGRWKGFEIGSYVLMGKIGSGGMGQVYLAKHRGTQRQVAVKVLNPQSLHDAVARIRFEREARAAAGLVHQNIVRVLDVNAKSNPPYLVMEYIDGMTWQAAVARSGTLTVEWAAYLGRQIASGLQCAHEAGTVHRDIKPANLLLDRRGQAKILDLGIARLSDDSGLTKSHSERVILGTADYLAPEQALDSSNVDSRADLYALGGTLYFLLAGRPPFPDGSAASKLMMKQVADPVPIERLRPDVPTEFGDIVRKLMARSPRDRHAAPAEAARALARFEAPEPEYLLRLFSDGRSTLSDTMQSLTPLHYSASRQETPTGSASESTGEGSNLYVSYRPLPVPPPAFETDDADLQQTLRVPNDDLLRDSPGVAVATASTAQIDFRPRKDRLLIALAIGAVAVAALLTAAAIVFFALQERRSTLPTNPPRDQPTQRLSVSMRPTAAIANVVSRSGKPGTYATVAAAVADAKHGFRIEIHEPEWIEAFQLPAGAYVPRDLTIVGMAPNGKPTVWRKPPETAAAAIVHLLTSHGITFDNIAFDGGNTKTRGLLTINVGGVTVRRCTFLGLEDAAVEMIGPTDEPTTNVVTHCRFFAANPSASAIRIAAPVYDTASRRPLIADNRFEGPYRDAVHLFGNFEATIVRNNRFQRCVTGVTLVRGYAHPEGNPIPAPAAVQVVEISRNTFSECDVGILVAADVSPIGSAIAVAGNYFDRLRMPAAFGAGSVAVFPRGSWNVVSKAVQEATLPLGSTEATYPIGLDPTDDVTFLRPRIAVGDKAYDRVGMPPAELAGKSVAEN